jgi:hippurate hydrolase
MCGHDGHITCLIGGLAKILEKREIIPSNCTLRAIFQPGEEGCGGATIMINDGVLEGVDEIYGLHNVPWDPVGMIYVQPKYMMAAIDKITFKVKGKFPLEKYSI